MSTVHHLAQCLFPLFLGLLSTGRINVGTVHFCKMAYVKMYVKIPGFAATNMEILPVIQSILFSFHKDRWKPF